MDLFPVSYQHISAKMTVFTRETNDFRETFKSHAYLAGLLDISVRSLGVDEFWSPSSWRVKSPPVMANLQRFPPAFSNKTIWRNAMDFGDRQPLDLQSQRQTWGETDIDEDLWFRDLRYIHLFGCSSWILVGHQSAHLSEHVQGHNPSGSQES